MNTASKSSITRLVAYLTGSQGCSSRVHTVRVTGCESEDPDWAAMEMLAVQQQNHRAKGDKTYHLMVSFTDRPSPEIIKQLESRICERLGFAEHQRVSVVHDDTDNLHLHIAVNKIHPEKLTMHEPWYDHKELARACVELEKEFGIEVDNHEFKTQARPNAGVNMEKAGDMESLTGWIQRNVLEELKAAGDWKTFGDVLARHDLSLRERGNGFVFVSGRIHVKASSVDRSLSKSGLEKRLGVFAGLQSSTARPEKRYERRPMPGSPSHLWEIYRREEAERQKQAQAAYMEQKDEAVGDYRLGNLLINQMTSGTLNKLILHKLNRARLNKQLQKIQWFEWNKQRARHHSDSLQYLLSRGRAQPKAYIQGLEKLPFGKPEKVTGKGTRLYPDGIKENDGRILIPHSDDAERIHAFAERHFSAFSVHGPDEVRHRMEAVGIGRLKEQQAYDRGLER